MATLGRFEAREHRVMGAKVKALIWEECRVGGAIAGVTLVVGLLVLLAVSFDGFGGPSAAQRDPAIYFLIVMGPPLLVALLLIFNPDYSGVLRGGYSQRVLRLPIPTSVAVAISLCARTMFVSLVTLITVAVAAGLFEFQYEFQAILLVTALYMGAQLVDWLRAPISGLSSVVVLVLAAAMVFLVFLLFSNSVGLGDVISAIFPNIWPSPLAWLALFAGGLVITYAIAVPAVHAARVGRSIGVPEIWDWPKSLSFGGAGRRTPFSSPVAAQVWYELRRSAWILPSVTLLVCLIGIGATWIHMLSTENEMSFMVRALSSFVPFAAVFLGAAWHGGRTSIAGFRRSAGTPGYAYLQPLTHAQFALSRIISNGIILFPVLIFAVAVHFSMAGGAFLFDVLAQALEQDLTSMREVVWTLLSRGFLVGLLAWALMAVSTRLIIVTIAAGSAISILAALIADGLFDADAGLSIIPASIFMFGLTAGAYAHAWRTRLISGRMIAVWACAWALATWLVYGASRNSIQALSPNLLWDAIGFTICLAMAALVPLPFIAVAIDVRRRRHSASPAQDAVQHGHRHAPFSSSSARGFAVGTAALATVAIVWLGWPARPAYEDAWRSMGYPATLAELDDWYPAVPPDENRALAYLEIYEIQHQKEVEFTNALNERLRVQQDPLSAPDLYDDIAIVGNGEVELGAPLPEAVRVATEEYWQMVTSHVAPALKELSAGGSGESRYPIDLREGPAARLDHLAQIRGLARELGVDSLHWSLAGQPSQTADSLIAVIPVANSLAEEPILISQLVRIAVLGIAVGNLEWAMNRYSFEERDLARLQTAFAEAIPSAQERLMFDRAIIGEGLFALDSLGQMGASFSGPMGVRRRAVLGEPLRQLTYPATTERTLLTLFYMDTMQVKRLSWPEFRQWSARYMDRVEKAYAFAPLFAILAPAMSRVYESEWRVRTQFDLAVTALAVERYRLAQGRLPERLTDLVPAFLTAVPKDYFSATGGPILYRPEAGGNFVVYSVSRDMEDDGGEKINTNWYSEGDITFSVVSRGVD